MYGGFVFSDCETGASVDGFDPANPLFQTTKVNAMTKQQTQNGQDRSADRRKRGFFQKIPELWGIVSIGFPVHSSPASLPAEGSTFNIWSPLQRSPLKTSDHVRRFFFPSSGSRDWFFLCYCPKSVRKKSADIGTTSS